MSDFEELVLSRKQKVQVHHNPLENGVSIAGRQNFREPGGNYPVRVSSY